MSANPYKAFVPYTFTGRPASFGAVGDLPSRDPSGGQWRTMGFVAPIKFEGLRVSLDGMGDLFGVQINERILPGKVRDEQVVKAVAKLEADEGRKISKKEFAELREQVEFDMLPRAFIRRTLIPVIFTGSYLLICTSSSKRADDVIALLKAAFGEGFKPQRLLINNYTLGVSGILTDAAKNSQIIEPADSEDESDFYTTDCAVLKGKNKRTIRVKDKPIDDGDIQALLKQDYSVVELGLRKGNEEDHPEIEFVVNENLIFKRVIVPDVKASAAKEDFFGFTTMCVGSYSKMLNAFIAVCGGLHQAPAADEDDEL